MEANALGIPKTPFVPKDNVATSASDSIGASPTSHDSNALVTLNRLSRDVLLEIPTYSQLHAKALEDKEAWKDLKKLMSELLPYLDCVLASIYLKGKWNDSLEASGLAFEIDSHGSLACAYDSVFTPSNTASTTPELIGSKDHVACVIKHEPHGAILIDIGKFYGPRLLLDGDSIATENMINANLEWVSWTYKMQGTQIYLQKSGNSEKVEMVPTTAEAAIESITFANAQSRKKSAFVMWRRPDKDGKIKLFAKLGIVFGKKRVVFTIKNPTPESFTKTKEANGYSMFVVKFKNLDENLEGVNILLKFICGPNKKEASEILEKMLKVIRRK